MIKVLLSGEGADELFCGYRWFVEHTPIKDFMEYVPRESLERILSCPNKFNVDSYNASLSLNELFRSFYLQRWLIRQDITGMYSSTEIRVPFLGRIIAGFVNSLDPSSFCVKGETKIMLKELLVGTFHDDFIYRRKIGFDFPLNDWIGNEHYNFICSRIKTPMREQLDSELDRLQGSYYRARLLFARVNIVIFTEGKGRYVKETLTI